jgi:hypothetical protein
MSLVVREYTSTRVRTLRDGTSKSYTVKSHKVIKNPVSYRKLGILTKNITDRDALFELEKWLLAHQPDNPTSQDETSKQSVP